MSSLATLSRPSPGPRQAEFAPFGVLDLSVVRALRAAATEVCLAEGELLFRADLPAPGLAVIISGAIGLYGRSPSHRSCLIDVMLRNDVLGIASVPNRTPLGHTVSALASSVVRLFPIALARRLAAESPQFGQSLMGLLATQLGRSRRQLVSDRSSSTRARLAAVLLRLKDECASVDDEGVMTLTLPMARRDLASLLGARVETVSRVLRALCDDGVAQISGRIITISDLDTLLDELETGAIR